MRKLFTFLFAITLIATQLSAQNFVKVNGKAKDIAISPKDGMVYIVDQKGSIKQYNSKTKRFEPFGGRQGNFKSVSVTRDGVVYGVSNTGEVFIEVKGRWIKVAGIQTNEVVCEQAGNNIYAIGKDDLPYILKGGKWSVDSRRTNGTTGIKQMVAINSKKFAGLNMQNQFMEYVSGKWVIRNGKPNQIALDHWTKEVYAVGRNKGVYRWNSKSRKWILLPKTRKDFKSMAVHNGVVWATTESFEIYCNQLSNEAPFSFNNEKPKVVILLHGITASISTESGQDNKVNTIQYPQFYWGYDFLRLLSGGTPTQNLFVKAAPRTGLRDSDLSKTLWSNHRNGVVLRNSVKYNSGLAYVLSRPGSDTEVMCTYRDGGAGLMTQTKAAINQIYESYQAYYGDLPADRQPMIYLLAHSFGGIVCRTILTNPAKKDKQGFKLTAEERKRADFIRDRTVWLTTLSTPHTGSPLPGIAITGDAVLKDLEKVARNAGFNATANGYKYLKDQVVDGRKPCLQDIKDYKFYDNAWLNPENATRTNGSLVPIYTLTGANPGHTFFLHKRAMGSIFDNSMNDIFDYHDKQKHKRGYHKLGPESVMLTSLDVLLATNIWPKATGPDSYINRFSTPVIGTNGYADALLRSGINIEMKKDKLVDSDGFVSFTSGHGLKLAGKDWTHFSGSKGGSWYRIYGREYGGSHPWDLDNHRSICYNQGTGAFIGNYLMDKGPNATRGKWSTWTNRPINPARYKKRVRVEITALKNLLNEDIGDGFRCEVKIGGEPLWKFGYDQRKANDWIEAFSSK